MDDPSLTEEPRRSAEPAKGRRFALGPAASLLVLGLVVGLAVGWLVWRERGPGAAASTGGGVAGGTMVEGIDVSNDPVEGPADAPVTIVEFSDFECPFCARFANQTAPLLRSQYGDSIRWIFVNYPLESIHPKAYDLALAGECAGAQERFWDFYRALFSGRYGSDRSDATAAARDLGLDVERFEGCLTAAEHAGEVAADLREGQKFYILGTPTFFVNGKRMEGALPPEAFAAVIDSILSL